MSPKTGVDAGVGVDVAAVAAFAGVCAAANGDADEATDAGAGLAFGTAGAPKGDEAVGVDAPNGEAVPALALAKGEAAEEKEANVVCVFLGFASGAAAAASGVITGAGADTNPGADSAPSPDTAADTVFSFKPSAAAPAPACDPTSLGRLASSDAAGANELSLLSSAFRLLPVPVLAAAAAAALVPVVELGLALSVSASASRSMTPS